MAGLLYTEVEKSLFINSDSDEYSSSDDENETGDIDAPARIRRAETVLAHRTSRIVLILEDLYNGFNEQAILRTAESFGVLNVFIIKKEYVMKYRKDSAKIAQGSKKWVSGFANVIT